MKDKLTLKAKKEGYLARSVYKLLAINSKYKIIKKNDRVLDLGCWPGSWIQACLELECKIVGVDLKEIDIKEIDFIQDNVFDKDVFDKLLGLEKFDVVLSDLSPQTTGIKDLDQTRSLELCYKALEIARYVLKEKGNFLCKIFQSNETTKFMGDVKKYFKFVKINKPEASKKRSKEIYLIARSKHSL